MTIASFGLNHQKVIAFVVAALAALGVWAYTVTPASIFPDMTFARIDVVAVAGDLPPDQVRTAVSMPLERALLGLPSVTRVQTTSSQGSAEFIVTFDTHSDVRFDLQYVDQAISQTRSELPAGVAVHALVINPNQEPVISYAFVSPSMSQTVLRELVQQTVVPQFYGTPGLARSLVVGGPVREYHVTLDPAALALHGLTPQGVGKAISDATDVNAIGLAQHYYQRNVLLLDANVKSASAVENIVVSDASKRPVFIRSLGRVTLGVAPATSQMSFDGHHGVAVNFFGLPGADAVKMAAEVRLRMDALRARVPVGIAITRYWDQTDLIVES
ncbi:MAG: efflux RND transporter permease subunit, partial [Candidatus Eremiobacteraeota bacterium]|nr:efflux RND transporter permease subunit [Candidatus Eremiobacteraeota bacterium]